MRVHAVDDLVSRGSAEDELLLVDDVSDPRSSLDAVIAELKNRCQRRFPKAVRTATVYDKPTRQCSH